MTPFVCSLIALSAGAAWAGLPTPENIWIGADGDWNEATNWASGQVPDFGSVGVFNGATVTATGLTLNNGSGLFGGTAEGASGDGGFHQIGGTSRWFVAGGLQAGVGVGTVGRISASAEAVVLGELLTLANGGSAYANFSGDSQIGARFIRIGAATPGSQSPADSSHGSMVVEGAGTRVFGSSLGNGAFLTMGTNGTGHLTIRNGAGFQARDTAITSTSMEGSSLTIEGPGSVFQFGSFSSPASMVLGRSSVVPDVLPVGDTVLTLRDGGRIENGAGLTGFNAVDVGTQSVVRGSGVIESRVNNLPGGLIDPGEGSMYGHLEVSGLLNNRVLPSTTPIFQSGTLHFDIGGTALHEFDRLTVGALFAGGTLEIALADAFVPVFGDSFEIIKITDQDAFDNPPNHFGPTGLGMFGDIDMPALSGGLYFDLLYSESGVIVTVVPSAPTLTILAIGSLSCSRRSRKSHR